MKKIISTDRAPAAIGPYSQAVQAGGFLYISGQLALDPATGELRGDDVKTQTKQALENLTAIADAAGYSLADAVKATVYLQSIGDFAAMNEVYGQYFSEHCPARAAFEVAALPKGGLVEIELVLYK